MAHVSGNLYYRVLELKKEVSIPKIQSFDVSKTEDTLVLNIVLENGDVFEGKFKRDYKIFYTRWLMGDIDAAYNMFLNIKNMGLENIQSMLNFGFHCEKLGCIAPSLMINFDISLEFQTLPVSFKLDKI